jgi:hypothetical protein
MEKLKNREILTLSNLEDIKRNAQEAFKNIGSEDYRQKLVYLLLSTVKSGDQKEFFFCLMRVLNSKKEDIGVKNFVKSLNVFYPFSEQNFEKLAYTIIMSIIAQK